MTKLGELVHAITKELTFTWKIVEDRGHTVTVADHVGHIFVIRSQNSTYKPGVRLIVYGIYPENAIVDSPKITVSSKRTPKAIAKDIEHRFIPVYLHRYNLAVQRLEDVARSKYLRHQIEESIAAASGGRVRPGGGVRFGDVQSAWGRATVGENGNVTITFYDLPAGDAFTLLKTFKEQT